MAPGSASAALRCLWAYPTVQGVDGRPTPLRVAAATRLLVHAPPETWGWCAPPPADPPAHAPAASPETLQLSKKWYKYTKEESNRIWIASSALHGSPPVLD